MSVIFYFSSQSTAGIGHTQISRILILKTFHLIEYATLAVLLFFAYKKYKYAIITAYLYAISDELHQSFIPGRSCKFTDTLIDLTGIIIGIIIIHTLIKHTFVKKIFTR
jgi:VanZ family protein